MQRPEAAEAGLGGKQCPRQDDVDKQEAKDRVGKLSQRTALRLDSLGLL